MARTQLDWARFLPPFGLGAVSSELANLFSNEVVCMQAPADIWAQLFVLRDCVPEKR